MTIYSDFSSLLQLGVGIGIGLSLFRAPVDLRLSRISRILDAELAALRGNVSPFAKSKRRDIRDLKLRFGSKRDRIDQTLKPFMVAAVLGAMLNLIGLIVVTLLPDQVAGQWETVGIIFVAVGGYIIELIVLEVYARLCLSSFVGDLERARSRRAPPLQ